MEDNEELRELFEADQRDRHPSADQAIDWSVVAPRDATRLARVRELYQAGELRTGADYYHAALVLQHSCDAIEDYLLAHDLCVIAIAKGEARAKWLAAAAEDRFLVSLGRPQRFGTQYRIDDDGSWHLYEVDASVTDALRQAMDVPKLAASRIREMCQRSPA